MKGTGLTIEHPTCLLYLLTVGRDKELVLRVPSLRRMLEITGLTEVFVIEP